MANRFSQTKRPSWTIQSGHLYKSKASANLYQLVTTFVFNSVSLPGVSVNSSSTRFQLNHTSVLHLIGFRFNCAYPLKDLPRPFWIL